MSLQAFEQGADIAFAIAEDDAIGDFFAVKKRSQGRALLHRRNSISVCDTFLFVEEGGATSMRLGACRNCSDRRVISGGMVAEKNCLACEG